jgi:transcriptional regulator with XRE-family HTH domain
MADYLASETKSSRNSLDLHIGSRVKTRRSFLGISQEKLGNYLGITFQQIQKYEKGANRISASALHRIADILSVDLSYFFEGYNGAPSVSEENAIVYELDQTKKKETAELLRSYYKIENPAIRKKVCELVKSIAISQKID